jgi:hypothetical protein
MLYPPKRALFAGLLLLSALGPVLESVQAQNEDCPRCKGVVQPARNTSQAPRTQAKAVQQGPEINYAFGDETGLPPPENMQPRGGMTHGPAPRPMPEETYYDEDDSAPCQSGMCGTCPDCCPPPRIWVTGEALEWCAAGMRVPVLASTGVLGAGTTALFGGGPINDDLRAGFRLGVGGWLDDAQTIALESTYLKLGQVSDSFSANNGTTPLLARPFLSLSGPNLGQNNAQWIAGPAATTGNYTFAGNLNIRATSDFQTADIVMRRLAGYRNGTRVDFLFGYRWAELKDHLGIRANIINTTLANSTIDTGDTFDSRSTFAGVQFGMGAKHDLTPWWWVEFTGKTAVGMTRSVVDTLGASATWPAASPETITFKNGGLLVQPSNAGSFDDNNFGILSELALTVHRRFARSCDVSLGYTFMCLTGVERAGDQVDTAVDTSQNQNVPNGTVGNAPTIPHERSDYWAQGFRLGFDYAF